MPAQGMSETLANGGNTANLLAAQVAMTAIASGTWGGATLTLRASADAGSTFVNTTHTLTANGVMERLYYSPGVVVDFSVSGGTTATSIQVDLFP